MENTKFIKISFVPTLLIIWLLTWREPDLLGALIKIAYQYAGE